MTKKNKKIKEEEKLNCSGQFFHPSSYTQPNLSNRDKIFLFNFLSSFYYVYVRREQQNSIEIVSNRNSYKKKTTNKITMCDVK